MEPENRTTMAIIGAGRLGQAMDRTALRVAGRRVVIANSRGPESLSSRSTRRTLRLERSPGGQSASLTG
jgi:predicted dinucleotide-binding enzyme